jgi:hypothetical protein
MHKYYIYYTDRRHNVGMTTVILGVTPLDAVLRAIENNILGESANGKYYVNESGTTEKKRRKYYCEIKDPFPNKR